MFVLAIASPEALADLDANSARLELLGDPRMPADVDELIATTRPAYWITAGLHSTELGPPETVMELAYRLTGTVRPKKKKRFSSILEILKIGERFNGTS